MRVRTRQHPEEPEFILKNKKFEHILSWSILLMMIGSIGLFLSYFVYLNTQNFYMSFMLWSNIFSFMYIGAIYSPLDGKSIKIQWRKLFQKCFSREFFVIMFSIISFTAILYSSKGVYGIFIALNTLLLIYVLGSIFIFLGKILIKLIFGELNNYIKSKLIFQEDFRLQEIIELRASKNIEHSMNYYNSKKLKSDFQSYLFWKDSSINLLLGYTSFIFSYGYLLQSAESIGLGGIFSIALFITGIFMIYLMKKFLYYIIQKKKIQVKSLSFSPKTYAWKNKNTLYFK